jgi:hypothetical protein
VIAIEPPPFSDLTYGLHTECVTTLIQLLSSPVVSTKPAFQLRSYRAVMLSHRAPELTAVLLNNFAEQKMAPATYLSGEGGSIVLGLASGMWSILTLGYGSVAAQPSEAEAVATKPLADFSLLMLLILTNHCTDSTTLKNPYRSVLFTCTNSYGKSCLMVTRLAKKTACLLEVNVRVVLQMGNYFFTARS